MIMFPELAQEEGGPPSYASACPAPPLVSSGVCELAEFQGVSSYVR